MAEQTDEKKDLMCTSGADTWLDSILDSGQGSMDASDLGEDLFCSEVNENSKEKINEFLHNKENVMVQTTKKTTGSKQSHEVSVFRDVAVTDQIPTPVMTIDRDMNVLTMNPAGASLLGMTPEECSGRKCYELFKTPHCNTDQCQTKMAMEQNRVFTGETVADPSGLNMPIRYTGAPLRDENGEVIGGVEYVLDITVERKQQAEVAKLVNTFDQLPTPVMSIDRDFNVTVMNSAGAKVLGMTPEECSGRKCYELFKTPHCNTDQCQTKRAMEQNRAFTGETVADPSGLNMPIRYTGAPIRDESGKVVGGVEYVLDITDEERSIHEIQRLVRQSIEGNLSVRADLDELNGSFNDIGKGLNEMLEAILVPIGEAMEVLDRMSQGDLSARVRGDYQGDQAKLKNAINSFQDMNQQVVEDIRKITGAMAEGNLRVRPEADYQGDFQQIQNALNTVIDTLNENLNTVASATEQVSSAVEQVTAASQNLASVSQEQSSAVEEVSSSVEETDSQVKANAENADVANHLVNESATAANHGQERMQEMLDAMNGISEASQNIAKIIKVIDEIAFQTNLLALNAAVEAARAGQHGKGFAVVAQEVRNLAGRSAKAAKETADLIEDAVGRVKKGVGIANETATALESIQQNVVKVKDLIAEIATASQEQSQGMAQINDAISQVAQGAQNAAQQSEELSSSADEMNRLVNVMKEAVATFELTEVQTNLGSIQTGALPAGITPEMLQQIASMLNGGSGNDGKPASASAKKAAVQTKADPSALLPLDHDERGFGDF